MTEKTPWSVSQKTENFLIADGLLNNVPWDISPEKPLYLMDFLKKLHTFWPFTCISFKRATTLNLVIEGINLKYEDLLDFMVSEIEALGNKVYDIDLSPSGFTLLLLRSDDTVALGSVSIFANKRALFDLNFFDKKSVQENLTQLTTN